MLGFGNNLNRMPSLSDFVTPEFTRVPQEVALIVVQACLIAFMSGAWIAVVAYRAALKSRSAAFFWCGNFAAAYALWNLFFLSSLS